MELLEWYNLIFVAPIGLSVIYLILSASGIGGDSDHDIGHDMDHDVEVAHDVDLGHDVDMSHDVDLGHDVDMDHDVDVAADHEVEVDHGFVAAHDVPAGLEHEVHDTHLEGHPDGSFLLRALSVMGFGKVPVSILVTCLMVIFGATGLICNGVFATALPWKWAPTLYFWPSFAVATLVSVSLTGWTATRLARLMPTMETYAIKPTDLEGNVGIAVYALTAGQMGTVDVHDAGGTLHRVAAMLDADAVPKGEDVILVRYHRDRDYYDVSQSPL